jgi:hypothetical protein
MAGHPDARLMDGAALSRTILEGAALRAAAFADGWDDRRAWRPCSSATIRRRLPTSR